MRFLLEQFERHRDEGMAAYKAGRLRDARYQLLKAAEYLFRVAAQSSGTLREQRKRNAQKLLEMAKGIEVPDALSEETADAPGGETGAGAQRWIVRRKPGVRFTDIAGLEDVKALVKRRVIYPFVHPEATQRYKKKAGGGVLLYGPPGTGKTMMAKAIASELEATFFSVKCSDIITKWVGQAEKNLQRLFAAARACPRAVVFLDETEAIVSRRGSNSTVMNRVIPEFLSQVDGLGSESESALLLLGATNRPWDMDEAALRAGRFGELIYVGLPDCEARLDMLRRGLEDVPVADGVDIEDLARRLEGYTGADINGLLERATDLPYEREIRTGQPSQIEPDDVEAALERTKPSVTEAQLSRYAKFRRVR